MFNGSNPSKGGVFLMLKKENSLNKKWQIFLCTLLFSSDVIKEDRFASVNEILLSDHVYKFRGMSGNTGDKNNFIFNYCRIRLLLNAGRARHCNRHSLEAHRHYLFYFVFHPFKMPPKKFENVNICQWSHQSNCQISPHASTKLSLKNEGKIKDTKLAEQDQKTAEMLWGVPLFERSARGIAGHFIEDFVVGLSPSKWLIPC